MEPRRICPLLPCAVLLLLAAASPARADLTAFVGAQSNPSTRLARGLSAGSGFLIVGFEGEYAQTSGDDVCLAPAVLTACAPSVRTVMFNGLVQTPKGILPKVQLYATIGGGYYRIRFEPLDVQGEDVPAGFFRSRQVAVSIRVQAQTESLRRLVPDRVFTTAIRLRNAS